MSRAAMPQAADADFHPRRICPLDKLAPGTLAHTLYPFAARMPAPDRPKPDAAALPQPLRSGLF